MRRRAFCSLIEINLKKKHLTIPSWLLTETPCMKPTSTRMETGLREKSDLNLSPLRRLYNCTHSTDTPHASFLGNMETFPRGSWTTTACLPSQAFTILGGPQLTQESNGDGPCLHSRSHVSACRAQTCRTCRKIALLRGPILAGSGRASGKRRQESMLNPDSVTRVAPLVKPIGPAMTAIAATCGNPASAGPPAPCQVQSCRPVAGLDKPSFMQGSLILLGVCCDLNLERCQT